MSEIPKDAREIYCNESGEPIAFCPKESIGLTDLHRAEFYNQNRERMVELRSRAVSKGGGFVALCIDVDDPAWASLVEALMPGHDWNYYRQRAEKPVARGVVPRELVLGVINDCYPAALPVPDSEFIAVFAAGGIMVI